MTAPRPCTSSVRIARPPTASPSSTWTARPLRSMPPAAVQRAASRAQCRRPRQAPATQRAAAAGRFLGALVRPLPHDGAGLRGRGCAARASVPARRSTPRTSSSSRRASRSAASRRWRCSGADARSRASPAMGQADIVRWARGAGRGTLSWPEAAARAFRQWRGPPAARD